MFSANIASFSLAGEHENSDAMVHVAVSQNSLLLAIADGVGSAQHGGDAARLAIATCAEARSKMDIASLFSEVSQRIRTTAGNALGQWSTTLSVCFLRDGVASVGHVGDTRIYHLRGNGLQTRTRDQTEVQRLIEDGVLSRERARKYPRRNVLLSVVGADSDYDLQQTEFALLSGDRVMLLSDGVYRQVGKHEIVSLSKQHSDVSGFVDAVKEHVITAGIVDDSSVLCAEIRFE